jgi:phosphoglucomutase
MDRNKLLQKINRYIGLEEDIDFRSEVEELVRNEKWEELNDRFYQELSFGTGGLRGIIGGGFNRMNSFIVKRATQGLANYIKKASEKEENKVVIAYDSRRFSKRFAKDAACVLAGNSIKAYRFSSLRPTPELSYAVRKLNATAGIVITASHNPKEYNGYKVYWSDGGQIIPPHDKGIIDEVRLVRDIKSLTEGDATQKDLIKIIDKEIDRPYIDMVKGLVLRPELLKKKSKKLKVVYTPLHGSGAFPVSTALNELGVKFFFVQEQKEPDGNFPTVKVPNPEEASALSMAIELARKKKAHMIMATDPDCDRLGIAVLDGDKFTLITGNQLGVLLTDYIFKTLKEQDRLPEDSVLIKTIVTTELERLVAEGYGGRCIDTLTGFKYIGEKIREFENRGPAFIFGNEESYGYLFGTEVRDKDAVSAVVMTVEMAIFHQSQGKTIMDRLNEIYRQYGYFQELVISKYFKGESGFNIMNHLLDRLRENTPKEWAGQKVIRIKDYKERVTKDVLTGKAEKNINLPVSNVIQFLLEDNTVISARPSGTEPKIKFYISCCSKPGLELKTAKIKVQNKIKLMEEEIENLI